MNELTKKGLETYTSIRGKERAKTWEDRIEKGGFGSAMTELSAQYAFGSVWARDGLARRDKSLVTIGILLALRQTKSLSITSALGLLTGSRSKRLKKYSSMRRCMRVSLRLMLPCKPLKRSSKSSD
jgi:4-carboxymuconolactone decarboxylase